MRLRATCSTITLAILTSAALISGRRTPTEEVQDAIDATLGKAEGGEILVQDPAIIPLEEIKKWEKRHPGQTLFLKSYEDKLPFIERRKRKSDHPSFRHPGMKKPPRMWQPNGQVPKRVKQDGLEEGIERLKSPFR